LYVRIWLGVVLTVAVLTLLVGWVWRMAIEPPLREMVVRDAAGLVVGTGYPRQMHPGANRMHPPDELYHSDPDDAPANQSPNGPGPEFTVRMEDGQTLQVHLPRPPRSPWTRLPFGFIWSLTVVGIAVALTTYPIVRKLTRRLELLQKGVEEWGAGDLSVRVPVRGHDEVAFLAERFNLAAQRIETLVDSHTTLLAQQQALLQAQKSLLANASHELRSPLARIRMGLELLGGGASPSTCKELARNISELDQLIDEILLASRLDAQETDLGTVESVDLTGLVAEECARVDAQLEVQAEANGQGSVIIVDGVARLLRRLVRNLLENARRYSDGEITVLLCSRDVRAVLSVCDRGPGVPSALRDRIFEPFYRLPGASERDGGVGLGLALVKSIAARHAGSVRCDERAGGGACFVVELPLAPEAPTVAATPVRA
jgi:signal transduction histidine kinase